MEKMRNATLVFLVKKSNGKIEEICLAMKKRGFGVGRWNGVGGKQKDGETIEGAAIRETNEEIGVEVKNLDKVAELTFHFSKNSSWNQIVHTYFTEDWTDEPTESEEMNPKWFKVKEIPFEKMWPDDIFWLPEVLKGNLVKADFTFGENDVIEKKEVKIVKSL